MKAGLVFADMLSTVSPTYAREIQTPHAGVRAGRLAPGAAGRPARDRQRHRPRRLEPGPTSRCSPAATTSRRVETGKAECKAWLQAQGRPPRPSRRSRCSPRSAGSIPRRAGTCWPRSPTGCSSGTSSSSCWGPDIPSTTELLEELARRHQGKLWAHLGFSDDLAHQIEAGADLFLMPSLFEPCGLNQLYSLAHGTVPLVRATGGLADTVVDLDAWTLADRDTANGFVFPEPTAEALWEAIERALAAWADRAVWEQLIRHGMAADWSWDHSAREYVQLYEEIVASGSDLGGANRSPVRRHAQVRHQIVLSWRADVPSIFRVAIGAWSPTDLPFLGPESQAMASVSLALMWHQHQPYYPDDVAGENPMPWVRLHATKDYLGMALHLEEVPEFHCTINLVPSLLTQLEAYVAGATDTHLTMSRRPVDGLDRDGRRLPARQLLHGLRRLDDPAASAVSRAVHAARVVGRLRPTRRWRGSGRAICATFRSGRTWPGSIPCSSRRTRSSPSSRPRGATTPRTRSSGCWTSSASCWARSFRCIASWPSAARSS